MKRALTTVGALAALGAGIGVGYAAYRSDLEAARRRVARGSQVIATARGPVEYAEAGRGPVVLVVHGAGGGFDQGMELAELAQHGFRVIAMSRFGYLRTPLPTDASPQAQADAHARLLDALGIERAAIVGVSAGAPSSLEFALRHPDRTRALVLLVPLAYWPAAAKPPSGIRRFMLERAVQSDALYWLALRATPNLVVKTILATPPSVLAQAAAGERARVERLMEHILPLGERRQGLLNDAAVAQRLADAPLEKIAAPTLLVSAADDLYGTYESARYTAARIPGARFVGYSSGGHVWVNHHAEVMRELSAFLSGAHATLAERQ